MISVPEGEERKTRKTIKIQRYMGKTFPNLCDKHKTIRLRRSANPRKDNCSEKLHRGKLQ